MILRKLGAYPRQNSLALALRELGRVERTLFTLEWLQNPELRRRVQVGLNKGEAKNALARAVFFNRLGELRDLTPHHLLRTLATLCCLSAVSFWSFLVEAQPPPDRVLLPDLDSASPAPCGPLDSLPGNHTL